jgi:hypothetical protein
LQPVSVETNPQVGSHLLGGRVVRMEGLPGLRRVGVQAHERFMIDRIPNIVESCTDLHVREFIGQRIVGINHEEIVFLS